MLYNPCKTCYSIYMYNVRIICAISMPQGWLDKKIARYGKERNPA